ncbi:MAG: hypothetical protein OHK0023_23010 [Anaerolineae bacterium]
MLDSSLLVVTGILALIVILANVAEQRIELRPLLYVALAAINVTVVLSTQEAFGAEAALIALGLMLLATLPLLRPLRGLLVRMLPSRQQLSDGSWVGFNPEAPTHVTALVFCVYLVANTLLSAVTQGGVSGISEDTAASAESLVSLTGLLTQMLIFVAFGLLGAGFGLRRSLASVMARLGLRAPTLNEIGIGIGIAILLIFVVYGLGVIWQFLAPAEVFEDQTSLSGLIANGIDTMLTAFVLAFSAAVGEEIIFRGALQPVFGVLFSSAIFALTHIQYALTPAVLIIFVVSLGFAYVRRRYNTTVAIISHFFYNFALAALLVYSRYVFTTMERL